MAEEPKTFDFKEIVDAIIRDMKLGKMSPEEEAIIREEIEARVDKRIAMTILDNLSDKDFEKMTKRFDETDDKPEEEQTEILASMSAKIDGFDEKLAKALNALHDELTRDAEELTKVMKKGEKGA